MTDVAARHYDAIVLGAGAAGMMCAAIAGQRGKRVLLVEHADAPGKKILISGGGRCNFTNANTAPDRYLSANPHFAKSALARYTAQDFIALVDSYGIAWHEKTLGQLFCDGSAKQIVEMMVDLCRKGNVDWSLGRSVEAISHVDGTFRVDLGVRTAQAPNLVIATGGPSIPKMGATAFAYDLARQFGLKVVEPRPALVPLTLGGEDVLFRELSGVSADVAATAGKATFNEAALFTHRGLSGPAILQVSSYWRKGDPVDIDFFPGRERGWLAAAKRTTPNITLAKLIATDLSDRLAIALTGKIDADGPINGLSDKRLEVIESALHRWRFVPNGSEGLAKAEVTAGGIATGGLSSQTMEARKFPGFYAIGEAVDVTGWLGGYNFQWAWASGWVAGQAI